MTIPRRHLLITGLPGTGKTTLLMELVRRLAFWEPVGFYTEEVRERGKRRGFMLVSLNGQKGMLADVDLRSRFHVGRYGVDVGGFESFLSSLELLSAPTPVVFIDEIGKMESLSGQFIDFTRALFASEKTVVATVARKGEGWIEEVKRRPDCQLVEVTRANRERLPDELTAWLDDHLHLM